MDIPRPCLLLLVAIILAAVDYGNACRKPDSHGPTWNGGPGWEATWRFRKRRSDEANPDAAVFLRLCDVDESDTISFNELRKCLSIPSKTALEKLILTDTNGDNELSLNEMQNIRFDTSDAKTCYHSTLMTCGIRFLIYSRTRDTNEDTMCGALQEYVNCVAEDTTCDLQIMVTFKHALIDMVASGESNAICPNVDLSALGEVGVYNTLSCSKLAIVDCDIMFLTDLHDGVNPCESLAVYEQCVKETTENCDDDPARFARAGSHALVTAYLGNKICN